MELTLITGDAMNQQNPKLVNDGGSKSRLSEQVARSEAECQRRDAVQDDCLANTAPRSFGGAGGRPTGLVLYTNNTSQSYSEANDLLTLDEIMACETDNFIEYVEELAEKAILLKHREDCQRGLVVRPSDSSRYFERGQRKTKRNIKVRFGRNYRAPGILVTLTYDHVKFSRWEAWQRTPSDIKRFMHAITMRYRRQERKSPRYIWVIEEQKQSGYPHVHIFYPRLHWLLAKDDVENLWGAGRTRVEAAKGLNVGGYICKYITKMGGWSEEALAFIWSHKVRMYGYSRCYKMPVEGKEPSQWVFFTNTTRTRIEDNLALITKAIPNLENIAAYLEELPEYKVSQGRAKRGRRRALTDHNPA
jgi:hypothetical protein